MDAICKETGKAAKVRNSIFWFKRSTKSRHFFQTWSLAHSQNSRMLIALSHSEFATHLAASHSAHATSNFRDCSHFNVGEIELGLFPIQKQLNDLYVIPG